MIDDPLNRNKVKRGMDLPHAKLTDDDIRNIRGLIGERNKHIQKARELSNAKIAEKMGVHYRTIDRIAAGESWGHVA